MRIGFSQKPYYYRDKTGNITINDFATVWEEHDLRYSSVDVSPVQKNFTVPLSETVFSKNRTVYMHMEIETDYPFAQHDSNAQEPPDME